MHRYSKLGYVALNVSDVGRSVTFYRDIWGLQPNGECADGIQFLRCSAAHHDLILCRGTPGLKRLGWQLESEKDVDSLTETLRSKNFIVHEVSAAECRSLHIGPAIRFSCPFTGVTHEYYTAMEAADSAWEPTVANILRLGHVVLSTPRYDEAVKFYLDVLNFRMSDAISGAVSFMRCFPSPFHHSLGLGSAETPGLHHVNFMVADMDDVGRALWRLKKNEIPIVRGPGRHPPSGSMFLYVLDPDGLTVEYSWGMEEFPEDGGREHRVLPRTLESIDYWGGPTDARLGAVGAIEMASS